MIGPVDHLISHADNGGHMSMWDWAGLPHMGLMMVGIWLLYLIVAVLVFLDAQKQGMNGVLWFILVMIPWVGIVFLITYLVVRSERRTPAHDGRSQGRAMTNLDERYARGDIAQETYRRMRLDLIKDP